jgi:hypothetical protein
MSKHEGGGAKSKGSMGQGGTGTVGSRKGSMAGGSSGKKKK